MARGKQPLPTGAELEILRVLWNRGASTVREVYDELKRAKPVGYTTVLKFMQIMAEKGLVRRNEEQRTHVTNPCRPGSLPNGNSSATYSTGPLGDLQCSS